MEMALFDAEAGYYSRHINTIGRSGDFSTSATLSHTLSRAIARWLQKIWRSNPSLPRTVIEIGAGDGSLAQGIINHIGLFARHRLQYIIVEKSDPLIQQQVARLSKHRRCRWHNDMQQALSDAGGRAVIISNELIDAFPAELLQWDQKKHCWHQLLLNHNGDHWETKAGNAVTLPSNSSLNTEHNFADGQIIERHDSYIEWLKEWINQWQMGEMLTIDYGNLFPQLYHRQPRGTLRAYFAQNRLESMNEILARPGHQDITADVDFSDLRNRTACLNLKEIVYQSQLDFISEQKISINDDDPVTNPHGAGRAFKVLWQRRAEEGS